MVITLTNAGVKKSQKSKIIIIIIIIHAVRICSQDIGMEFVKENSAMLVMKSGKRHLTDRIVLPDQDKIRTPEKRKRKPTNTWASWRLSSGNERQNSKSISQEN